MTIVMDRDPAPARQSRASSQRIGSALRGLARAMETLGLGWLSPLVSMAAGEPVGPELKNLRDRLIAPIAAIAIFLGLWALAAPRVDTSLGALPGPAAVAQQAGALWAGHVAKKQEAAEFHDRQQARNAAILAADPDAEVRMRRYTGAPTYVDQIFTSLQTVFFGFVIASIVAIPVGVVCGLSRIVQAGLNPLIQIFKPVSPLAWLPIVTMVVSALYVTDSPLVAKSFLVSAITVALCSLWPTLINTAVGVASVDKDLMNVGRVLQLSPWTTVRRVVLPSALPYIFTGLRLSLGVGWMVLIAAEMLAQNPGLGKFVWDEFQNGSSASLARIMVAVLTIGLIGFLLDRLMLALQTVIAPQTGR
jgi:nitrate/nitrite transport system permease protein